MGSSTFLILKEELKIRSGNNPLFSAGGDSSLDYYGIWINSAYRLLCTQDGIFGLKKKLYFPQLMTSSTTTTIAGTTYIIPPSNCLYLTEVYDTTNNRKLDWVPWKQYISYTDRTTLTSRGDPTEYHRSGGYIYLHPTPQTTGDTMTMYFKKRVADLSGSLTTDIGAEWDDVILELATYKMKIATSDYDTAKFHREAFLEMAGGLAGIYDIESVDGNLYISPSLSYMGK